MFFLAFFVDAAWTEISGSVEERKQNLEESNKNLEIFQTTGLQLSQWLSEKELMMGVLGPLSIDPNMLKMQKQQVQVCKSKKNRKIDCSRKEHLNNLKKKKTVFSRFCRMSSRAVKLNMTDLKKQPLPSSAQQATKSPQVGNW